MNMYLFHFALLGIASALQSLPPVQWTNNTNPSARGFSLSAAAKTVYIDSEFASRRDTDGVTLIPPSVYEFAETFLLDLQELSGAKWELRRVDRLPDHVTGIFLQPFKGAASVFTYENGQATEEGYELEIRDGIVSIRGAGARGMWWGTRTFLQQLLLAGDDDEKRDIIPPGRVVDAPAYPTRGFMLDAGRKWYSPSYLKDLCTYASFFKMSEFHYHASDNYPLNRGRNETWTEVYSQFSLYPEGNLSLQGIIQRPNETLSRDEFGDFQRHCAQRGIAVIPEIEAPGHCLSITKWRPDLALETKDLLNLSHPDALPVVKSIWAEFLPWFQTKEVHIGADEYDSSLADDYITFVNEMASFIKSVSGKRTRIWGTYEPSKDLTISKDVIIQHWQYGQSDPVALDRDGYEIINSEEWWAYMSLKNDHMPILPAPYPQFFNNNRILNFADRQGWQWEPSLFNPYNVTEQLDPRAQGNKGAILAAWNDNGPDSTTQLESFYAMRDGIPVVASRAWTGSRGVRLDELTLPTSIDLMTSRAPGQDLDRRLPDEHTNNSNHNPKDSTSHKNTNPATPILSFSLPPTQPNTSIPIPLSHGSKGPPYTFTLLTTGPFTLSSTDTTLSLSPSGSLTFTTSDGWTYPLRAVSETDSLSCRIWTNATTSTHEVVRVSSLPAEITIRTDVVRGSRVWVDGEFVGRFEVFVFGGRNTLFSWSQMAFVAPLEAVEEGGVRRLRLWGAA